ncbi:MAG: acyltransferase [Vicinamibacterales bacterium]
MARGLAAVAVLIYHVRYRFFLDYGDLVVRDRITTAWYFVTAFGHDAVMVFFVLSGFLIGSSVLRAHKAGRWSVAEYATSRAVRLSAVLIPGLLLTALWDRLGLTFFGQTMIYTGAARPFVHDFFDVAARSGLGTLAGNLLYLQTVLVPPFGSNDALWSLAFEGWYYVLFPLGIACVMPGRSVLVRLAAALLAAGAGYLLGPTIVRYMLFWLVGVGVCLLPHVRLIAAWRRVAVPAALLACVALISLGHVGTVRAALGGTLYAADTLTSVSFAVLLYVLLHDGAPAGAGWYPRAAAVLAGCSFTLYLVHLPLLVFLRALVNPGRSWAPTPATIGASLAIAIAAWIYAYGVAQVTEARTPALRTAALRWLGLRPHARQPEWSAADGADGGAAMTFTRGVVEATPATMERRR